MIAAVLSLPVLRLHYFWDDYWFLSRAQVPTLRALLPEQDFFYRPISRVLYFWPLAALGSGGAPVAHLINLVLVLLSVGLLATFVARIAGPRAGTLSGIFFASLATLPALVGWASASQDLLAIFFVLIAFHLRLSGRVIASAVLFVAALLSKETAAVLAPALILLDRSKARRTLAAYGAVLAVWLAIHPGIHRLVSERFAVEPRQYVGFTNLPLAMFHAGSYALALFHVPQGRIAWNALWVVPALFVGAVTMASVDGLERERRLSIPRALLLSLAIAAPTLLLPAFLLHSWAGYLLCVPGIGVAILLGVLASRWPSPAAVALAALFALAGIVIRGSPAPHGETVNEIAFHQASRAIHDVELGFRRLHPAFPTGSQLVISVAASGPLGIDGTMHDGQAPRVWYRDPTLRVVRPQERPRPAGAEYLFRIDGPDVWEIDPDRESVRTSGGIADREEVRTVIRTFARGLSASGDAPRAARILERLARDDAEPWRSYDLRLAAIGYIAARDSAAAARLLAVAPPITREFALYAMAKVFGEPTRVAAVDSAAYFAFGISSGDRDALRYWMNMFYASQIVPQARHFALRLQRIAPGDSEAAYVLERTALDRSETLSRR